MSAKCQPKVSQLEFWLICMCDETNHGGRMEGEGREEGGGRRENHEGGGKREEGGGREGGREEERRMEEGWWISLGGESRCGWGGRWKKSGHDRPAHLVCLAHPI